MGSGSLMGGVSGGDDGGDCLGCLVIAETDSTSSCLSSDEAGVVALGIT